MVYCLESIDNQPDIFKTAINPNSLQAEFDPSLMDGTWTIKGTSTKGQSLTFIPYMLWGNRGQSKMTVFVN
jgi:DUF1680 family protein